MATKTKKPPKARKPKAPKVEQGWIDPEMAPKKIKEIDSAAEGYYEIMMERTVLSKEEHELKENLIKIMLAHGETRYVMPDGKIVEVIDKHNVKVRKAKTPTKGGGDGEFVDDGED